MRVEYSPDEIRRAVKYNVEDLFGMTALSVQLHTGGGATITLRDPEGDFDESDEQE